MCVPGGSNLLRRVRHAIAFSVLVSISGVVSATGTQWTGPLTVSAIEVVGGAGGFVVYLTGFSDANCSSNPTGIYVYPNAEGVTQDGVNQMLAVLLAARTTGGTVSILYNDTGNVSSGLCYGEYLKS